MKRGSQKSSAALRTLPLFTQPDHAPSKPKKKLTKKSVSKKRFPGSFYGRTIPPLVGPDAKPYTCPCGRVRMMRNADGGVFLYDSQGPLGLSKVGKDYYGPLTKAIQQLRKVGCGFHPALPPAPSASPQSSPASG